MANGFFLCRDSNKSSMTVEGVGIAGGARGSGTGTGTPVGGWGVWVFGWAWRSPSSSWRVYGPSGTINMSRLLASLAAATTSEAACTKWHMRRIIETSKEQGRRSGHKLGGWSLRNGDVAEGEDFHPPRTRGRHRFGSISDVWRQRGSCTGSGSGSGNSNWNTGHISYSSPRPVCRAAPFH